MHLMKCGWRVRDMTQTWCPGCAIASLEEAPPTSRRGLEWVARADAHPDLRRRSRLRGPRGRGARFSGSCQSTCAAAAQHDGPRNLEAGEVLLAVVDDLLGGRRRPAPELDEGARRLPPALVRLRDDGRSEDRRVAIEDVLDLQADAPAIDRPRRKSRSDLRSEHLSVEILQRLENAREVRPPLVLWGPCRRRGHLPVDRGKLRHPRRDLWIRHAHEHAMPPGPEQDAYSYRAYSYPRRVRGHRGGDAAAARR